jgi:hypothetical protein
MTATVLMPLSRFEDHLLELVRCAFGRAASARSSNANFKRFIGII